MANLNNKVQEFRHQFNITKSFKDDQVFKLDPKGNLIGALIKFQRARISAKKYSSK